jgi:hypothetical protein
MNQKLLARPLHRVGQSAHFFICHVFSSNSTRPRKTVSFEAVPSISPSDLNRDYTQTTRKTEADQRTRTEQTGRSPIKKKRLEEGNKVDATAEVDVHG